jgi:hypothetical protein
MHVLISKTIPHIGWAGKRSVLNWTEYVEPVRQNFFFRHNIWIECDHPNTGNVADIMRRTRAAYHYRLFKRNEHAIVRRRNAESQF